ncbi:50S ribosomal protein L18, chloroplastic-like [Cyclospora cayetanensis]|uniref:50S ribosomal protein L18, chloroplastic-like n=1 Tax=Cyclospora cayetanensis TaxID=88456 RepID=A0A6P6RWM0_9EIME|nr:50S ribosomal protein L18, chloroplastic-like [Cyclospora cayetanensis]
MGAPWGPGGQSEDGSLDCLLVSARISRFFVHCSGTAPQQGGFPPPEPCALRRGRTSFEKLAKRPRGLRRLNRAETLALAAASGIPAPPTVDPATGHELSTGVLWEMEGTPKARWPSSLSEIAISSRQASCDTTGTAAPSVATASGATTNGSTPSSRLRLTLTLSNNHVYACITDKSRQHTFAFASSRDNALKDSLPLVKRKKGLVARPHGGTLRAAAAVGALVAARGLKAGINKVYFDRKKYRYAGRVAALADAARSAGLEF